jgi:basic membrane protein A
VSLLAGGASAGHKTARPLKVGLVLQAAGIDDPYLRGAAVGFRSAVRKLGIKGLVLTSGAREGFLPSFSYFARQDYDLIIGVGYLEAGAVDRAALRFPRSRFAIVDVRHDELEHRPKNVRAVFFKVEEASYLAGYLAALIEARRPGKDVVSSVGGLKVPTVDRFIAGYNAGARRARPRMLALHGYSRDFQAAAKCRAVAENHIARGAGVVFAVAGACGLGALRAAHAAHVYGVGVDVDQSALGAHVLTSVVKRLDVAVFETIVALKRGTFSTGGTTVFDLRDRGVGLGKVSPRVQHALVRKVERIRRLIVTGKIRNIPVTVR